jgi:hypothetical protein
MTMLNQSGAARSSALSGESKRVQLILQQTASPRRRMERYLHRFARLRVAIVVPVHPLQAVYVKKILLVLLALESGRSVSAGHDEKVQARASRETRGANL